MPRPQLTIVKSDPLPTPTAPAARPVSTDPRAAAMDKAIAESEAQQAESDRLASEHPILTTAAMVAAGAGPGLARAALTRGVPMAARAAGAVRAVAGGATPLMKYAAVKQVLMTFGMPEPAAEVAAATATAFWGGKRAPAAAAETPVTAPAPAAPESPTAYLNRLVDEAKSRPVGGAATTVATSEPVAAPAAPLASTPAAPTPPPAARTPESAAASPPAAAQSPRAPGEVGNLLNQIEMRTKRYLTPHEHQAAFQLVKQKGWSPEDAFAQVTGGTRAPATAGASPSPPAGTSPTDLTPDEAIAFADFLKKGQTPEQAAASILQLRALASQFRSASPAAVRSRVAQRNATGRWPQGGQP